MPTPPSTALGIDSLPERDLRLLRRYQKKPKLALEENIRIEDRDNLGGKAIPFRLNEAQLRLHELWEKIRLFNLWRTERDRKERVAAGLPTTKVHDGPVRIIVVKPRQVGISTYVQSRAFLDAMWNEHYAVNVTAHKEIPAQNVFRKAKIAYNNFDPKNKHLRFRASFSKDAVEWRQHESRFVVQTAGSESAARSYTFQFVHLSETAHFKSMVGVNALMGTIQRELATVISESTANGAAGPFYDDWEGALWFEDVLNAYETQNYEVLKQWNGFFRFFFPWFEDPQYQAYVPSWAISEMKESLDQTERALLQRYRGRCSLENIAWRRKKLKDMKPQPGMTQAEVFLQEFPASPDEAFVTSGDSFYDNRALFEMLDQAKTVRPAAAVQLWGDANPVECETAAANFIIYKPPVPGHEYVIGADIADEGEDHSVAIVGDRLDGTMVEEVACWWGDCDPRDFADIMTTIGEWYNLAFVCHEANNHGQVVSARLLDNRYPNIYFRRDRAKVPNERVLLRDIGMLSHWKSRIAHLGESQIWVRDKLVILRSIRGLKECIRFRSIDGKPQHPEGENDDYVIAKSLMVWGAINAPPIDLREKMDGAPSLFKPAAGGITCGEAIREKVAKSEKENWAILGPRRHQDRGPLYHPALFTRRPQR